MELLNLSGISKQLDSVRVLNDISFTQQRFQKIAIAGETGAGKTTLLKIIGGLLQTDTGQAIFENKKILGPAEKLIPGHDGIAYISQQFELRNNYRVEEELAYTNQLTDKNATVIFEICRVGHLLKRWTDELSGGEKQRIVTARALIAAPKLLLLDEPFSNLDMKHKQVMKAVIDDITRQLKITCILVSHDPLDILSWADEILVLKNGELIQKANAREIYLQPVNEYTAGLFGKYNLLTPMQAKLFADLATQPMGNNIMIRPEQFTIVPSTTKPSLNGIIKKIVYFGSYVEIDVSVEETTIIIRTSSCRHKVNDAVSVSVAGCFTQMNAD